MRNSSLNGSLNLMPSKPNIEIHCLKKSQNSTRALLRKSKLMYPQNKMIKRLASEPGLTTMRNGILPLKIMPSGPGGI